MLEITCRSWIPALILSAGIALLGFGTAHAQQSGAVTNKEVAQALQQAQKLAAKKQWSGAMEQIEKAERVPEKSAYAEFKIDEFKGYVLTQQRKYGPAAAVFEKLAGSQQASAAQRGKYLKTAAQLYMQANQHAKAAAAAQRALKQDPGDAELLELAGQAQYLAKNYQGAVSSMRQLVSVTQKQGKRPEESWLQLILNAYYALNDQKGIAETWMSLLQHYPKPEYWAKVLDLKTTGDQPEPIEMGYQRLMFELGLLKDPRDYEDLAMNTIDAGAPAEAVRVLSQGLESGKFEGAAKARFERMLEHAKKAAAARQSDIEKPATGAGSAAAGQQELRLGRAYVAQGKYSEAIAALRKAIEKGENPEEARLELGIAYLKADQPQQAQRTFAAVKRDSDWRDLAQLWSLHAQTSERETKSANTTS